MVQVAMPSVSAVNELVGLNLVGVVLDLYRLKETAVGCIVTNSVCQIVLLSYLYKGLAV